MSSQCERTKPKLPETSTATRDLIKTSQPVLVKLLINCHYNHFHSGAPGKGSSRERGSDFCASAKSSCFCRAFFDREITIIYADRQRDQLAAAHKLTLPRGSCFKLLSPGRGCNRLIYNCSIRHRVTSRLGCSRIEAATERESHFQLFTLEEILEFSWQTIATGVH